MRGIHLPDTYLEEQKLKEYLSTVYNLQLVPMKTKHSAKDRMHKGLKKGVSIEKEHKDLYNELKQRLDKKGVKMPLSEQEFYEKIAKAHLKENQSYYDLLEKYVEKEHKMNNGGKVPSVKEMHRIFTQVNEDNVKSGMYGGKSVPFSDKEYYAQQIQNIYDVSDKKADELAENLSKFKPKVEYKVWSEKDYDKNWKRTMGLLKQGYVDTDYAHLVKVFGKPTIERDDDKIRAEWIIEFDKDGYIATIYDYADYDKTIKKVRNWHIGGHNPVVVERIGNILGRLTRIEKKKQTTFANGGENNETVETVVTQEEVLSEDIILNALLAYKVFLKKSIKYFETYSIETLISKELKQEYINVQGVINEKKTEGFDVNKHLQVIARALGYYHSKLKTKIEIYENMGDYGEEFVDLFTEELTEVENKIEQIVPQDNEEAQIVEETIIVTENT